MVAKHKNNDVFFEDYTRLASLGVGAFASVFKVRHNKLGYVRAIRVLNKTICDGEKDPIFAKFIDECRLLLRLGNGCHPNIIRIFHPLLRSQQALVEMDYIDGVDLTKYVEDECFVDVNEVIVLAESVGGALAYCHEDIYRYCINREEDDVDVDPDDASRLLVDEDTRKRLIMKYRIIHNDMHSGNIMRTWDGRYVLLDFGLSIEGDSVVRKSRRENGAPEFKAPEKWDGAIPTPESDIYGFGVILYEMLAGRVPFEFNKKNRNTIEAEYLLGKAHKENEPPSIFELRKAAFEKKYPSRKYEKDYPDWLEKLILKCLAKKPEDRFADGKELYEFIKEYNSPEKEIARLRTVNDNAEDEITRLKIELKKASDRAYELQAQLDDAKKGTSGLGVSSGNVNGEEGSKEPSPVSSDLILLKREWRGVKQRAIADADKPKRVVRMLKTFLSKCRKEGAVELAAEVEVELTKIKNRGDSRNTMSLTPQMADLIKQGKLDDVKSICRKNGDIELLRKIKRLENSKKRISHLEKSLAVCRLTRDADKINKIINEIREFITQCDEISYPVSEYKTLLLEYSKIL